MGLRPQQEEGRNSSIDCAEGKGRKYTKRLVKGKRKKVKNPVLDLFVRKRDVILCLGMHSPKRGLCHLCFLEHFSRSFLPSKTSAPTLPMKCPP